VQLGELAVPVSSLPNIAPAPTAPSFTPTNPSSPSPTISDALNGAVVSTVKGVEKMQSRVNDAKNSKVIRVGNAVYSGWEFVPEDIRAQIETAVLNVDEVGAGVEFIKDQIYFGENLLNSILTSGLFDEFRELASILPVSATHIPASLESSLVFLLIFERVCGGGCFIVLRSGRCSSVRSVEEGVEACKEPCQPW
jgi:hypothetical protein